MLWRSLRDVAPSSATLAEDGRAELIYPDRREIRAWPSFESLDTATAGGAGPAATEAAAADLAASLARILGGSVSAVSAGPSGRVAALWTGESCPPWYRVVISSESGRVMTPDTVRVAGGPRWSPSGELAAGAFDGIRRGVIMIDPDGVRPGGGHGPPRPATGCWRSAPAVTTPLRSGPTATGRRGWSGPGRTAPTNPCNCFARPTKPEFR